MWYRLSLFNAKTTKYSKIKMEQLGIFIVIIYCEKNRVRGPPEGGQPPVFIEIVWIKPQVFIQIVFCGWILHRRGKLFGSCITLTPEGMWGVQLTKCFPVAPPSLREGATRKLFGLYNPQGLKTGLFFADGVPIRKKLKYFLGINKHNIITQHNIITTPPYKKCH